VVRRIFVFLSHATAAEHHSSSQAPAPSAQHVNSPAAEDHGVGRGNMYVVPLGWGPLSCTDCQPGQLHQHILSLALSFSLSQPDQRGGI